MQLHGKAVDVDLEAAVEMQALRDKLVETGYAADMDETGLFYRAMPRRSY